MMNNTNKQTPDLFSIDLNDGSFLSDAALTMATMRMGVTIDHAELAAAEVRVMEAFMLRNGTVENWGK